MSQRLLLWLRSDLRLHDHPLWAEALQAECVLPVYCVPEVLTHPLGFTRMGAFRAQFLIESLTDLRTALRARGSDLCMVRGRPAEVLPALVARHHLNGVWTSAEATSEELREQAQVEAALPFALRRVWDKTLYHVDDLPFELDELPDIFTQYRKRIEKKAPVRPLFATPEQLPPCPVEDPGALPDLAELGCAPLPRDARTAFPFRGGEQAALQHVARYLWGTQQVLTYKETRNQLLGADYSSKLSPWLALGCLSPRWVYHELQRFERQVAANDSTYWLYFELLWRDYFRFVALKAGDRLFSLRGLGQRTPRCQADRAAFERWCQGSTPEPFVNANMNELRHTGFMSNRGRQNVASYLCHDLGLDWRWGAAWFEHWLLDYDVCSNWGNWMYVAGVGNDPRPNRVFNVVKQAQQYDSQGDYVRFWT